MRSLRDMNNPPYRIFNRSNEVIAISWVDSTRNVKRKVLRPGDTCAIGAEYSSPRMEIGRVGLPIENPMWRNKITIYKLK